MSNDGAITTVGNQNTTVTDGNNSLIIAGNGNDVLVAGTNSIVIAGNGADTITVGAGSAIVVGDGNDTITDGANSVIVAGDGKDVVTVGANSAVVIGDGNDTLTLGANSVLVAGNGNDTVFMGASDTVAAGTGKNTFVVQADAPLRLTTPASASVKEDGSVALAISAGTSGFGFGNEVLVGFGITTDKIQFSTSQFANFAAVMAATKQVGSDTIITGDSGDTIDLVGVRLSSLTASNFVFTSPAAVTVTISGIPSGVTLSDTVGPLTVTNGSVTLTQAQLAGLTLKAGEVTTATLTVTAFDPANGSSTAQTIALSVTPVAPTLTLAKTTLTVNEDGTVALGITETPFDSRDAVSLTITGVPADATLSAGTKNSNGSWTLTPAQLSGLTLKAGEVTTATLTITATNTQGATAASSATIGLSVLAVAPALSTPASLTIAAGATVALGITETPFDSRDKVTLTITGVPSDATLSAGTKNSNGSWTLTPAQLSGLTLKAGQAATTTLVVTATNTLGQTASATQNIQLKIGTATTLSMTFDTVSFTDTGTLGDHITSNGSVTLSGTFTDTLTVSQVQVFNGTQPLGNATINTATHTWSLMTTLAQGTYNQLKATATDSGGNTVTATTTQTVQIDTTPPAITFDAVSFTDTGVTGDRITSNGNVTFSGTTSDNVTVSKVQVSNNGILLGSTTVSNGTWSLTTTLAQGTYNQLSATAIDEAGNSTSISTTQTVQVDTAPPAITFDTVSFTDTGVKGDHITNNGNVTFSGTTSDNVTVSQVQVSNNGVWLGNATVSNGQWTLTTTLAQGTYNQLSATATDEAGNTTSILTNQTVQVDTAAPAITFDTVSFTDTGVTGDHITNNRNVTFSGTTSDNVTVSQVQVLNNGVSLGNATISNGTWTLTATLAQGTYNQLSATATDEAGNTTSIPTAQSVQVDTAPPTITFDTVSFVDTGVVGDSTTNIGSVFLSGSVADNVTVSQVQVFNGSNLLGLATIDNVAHTWSLAPNLNQGTYNQLNAIATDEAGNTATAITTQTVQVDTAPPAITFDTVSFTDTGVTGDQITNNRNVTFSGTTSDNVTVSQVQVFNNGVSLGNATVSNGTWSLTTALAQGTYNSLSATATDEAGNTTSIPTAQTVQVDTAPPSITFDAVSFTDTGVTGDNITDNRSVTFSGTTSDNVTVSQVQVSNNGMSLGNATVSNGQWTLTATLAQGTYNALSATATDEAGNISSAATTQSVQIDATAPAVTFDSVSFAASGAAGVTDNNAITLSGTTSDNISVRQVEVFEGSQSLGLATVDNTAHSWTLTTNLNDGTYNQLNVTATDEAGNTASGGTAQGVQIDTSAPKITFDQVLFNSVGAPGSNISSDGQVTLSGSASDNVSVSQVEVFNGSDLIGLATITGGIWSLSTTLGQNTYNQLNAIAVDEAGNSSSASTKLSVTVSPASGYVADGYISGATVFADSNGDGILDDGEASGFTDPTGHFVLGAGTTTGPLIMTGGIDTATGLAFTGVLTAPTGSTQVTALTTLVQSVVKATGGSVSAASAAVASALGIDPSVDLTSLDTVAATYAGSSQAFVAASSILNTVSLVASAVSGTGATDFSAAATIAFAAIAGQISALPANTTLDLTSSSVVSSALATTAASSSATLTGDQTSGIVNVVTSVNTATNLAASSNTDPAALLTNVSATSIVAQGSASTQLQLATAPNADPTALTNAVSANTGNNLAGSVTSAVHQVGTVAPAPPTVLGLTPTDSTPTNLTVVHYLLAFSDPVISASVSASDFSLAETGLPGALIASITAVAGSSGAQYVIAINTGTGDGTVTLSFTGTTVVDLAGNALQDQTTHTGPTYTIDQGAIEQAALALAVTDTLINAAAAPTVHFSVAGLESADTGSVIFSDGTHQVKVNVSGAQTNYTANLSTLTDGPITSQLQVNPDAAGNVFTPVSGNSVTLDRDVNQQNVVSISAAGPGITNGVGDLDANNIITLTVNMSQAVTVSGTPTLTLNDGRTVFYSGPPSPTSVTALTFSYIVTPGDNTPDLAVSSINLNGGSITDLAGNNVNLAIAPGVNPASILQIDTTPPSVISLTQTDPTSTNASVVHYTITFSEAVSGIIPAEFSLVTTGVSGASIAGITAVAGSNGKQFTVAVNTGTGSGTVALNFNGGPAVQDLAGNFLPGGFTPGTAYIVAAPPPLLWGTSIVSSGDHFYGPSFTSDNGVYNLYYAETTSNFNVNGPDAVTQNLQSFDPFFLPFRAGDQAVASYNITTFPFTYNEILPITPIGNTTARQFDEIGVYVSDDANGNASINRLIATSPVGLNGAAPTVSAPTTIETAAAGTTVKYLITSFLNTNSTSGLLSTYEVAWDQYNAQTQTYQVEFQSFNADNSVASPVTQLLSQTGVTSYTTAEGWFFRAATGTVSADALLSATYNSATNSDVMTFQGYNVNGTLTSENFVLTPDLSHYLPGATSTIVQSVVNPPTRTGSILPVIFAPNATGGGYSAAWDETVTDSNGVHNQVEFAMFKANSTGVTGSLIKQATFQVTDGLPQQVRVGTFTYLGQSYEVLAYGDTTSSHVIEFDSNGNQIASYSEATNQFFNQLEVFGDGRVGLSYDNVIDSAGDTEFTTNIIDLRTSGIPSGYTGIVNASNHDFAGTQFNDTVVGVNNANNTYYFVGRNTTGQGPSDSFTGTLNGGVLTSWNTAIFADARSNYTISTVNGVTTITNVGDSAHAGTLTTTNVQELAFAPGVDPTPLSDGTVVADGTVVMLGQDGGFRPFTIDAGATLELAAAEGGVITFAGPTGTLQLDNAPSYSTIDAVTSSAGNFAITGQGNVATTAGDAIDFTSSGGAVGTPANLSLTTGGAISASSSTATGINVVQNGFGNITVDAAGGVSGGDYGVQAINNSDGNILVEAAGTVAGAVQYGILAKTIGAGSVSVTTDAGSVINSGSSGIVVNNRDQSLAASAHSTITVTSNGNINAGPTANLSGSASGGIVAGYNGNNVGLASVANTNVNGTVVVNNNASISGAAGYGINAFNYGNGNVTVNDAAGTSVSGGQYGIGAFEESGGTGDIAVNVAANASITGTSLNAIQAFGLDNGNISVTTSSGDLLNSGSTAINANNWATAVSASDSVTVVANGTIHSGSNLSSSGTQPSGIVAGFNPGGLNQASNAVAGSVFVTSNATIVAAAGSGINAYNYGTGNVTVTTGATSSTTGQAGNGISANAIGGGNVSVTNAGTATGTTGLFAGETGSGTIFVENDGTVTGTVNSGINTSQNVVGSTGSTTITNTGTVTGANNRSAINVNNDAGTATINNTGTVGALALLATSSAISENTNGTLVINNNNSGKLYGAVTTTSTGSLGANTTLNNNAGATWQTSFITDEGTINASGAGSTVNVTGTTSGIVVGNTGSGAFTASAGATVTSSFLSIGQLVGSQGTVTITGAGTTLNASTGQFPNISVGGLGMGSLTVANQAVVSTTGGLNVGVNLTAGVTSTLDVNNATLNAALGLTVGAGGAANATVEGGATVNTEFVTLGFAANSVGSLTVTGAGTSLNATAPTDNIAVGFDGTASLTVQNHAVVNTNFLDVAINHDVGVTDTLDVNNATLNAVLGLNIGDAGTANATVEGGGVVNTGFLGIGTQATGVGSLTVTGAGSVLSATGAGLGSSGGSATLTVNNGGAVDIGTGTTTVAGAVHIGSTSSLQGAGTIHGNVVNDAGGGLVVTTGQLEITGALSGSGSTTIDNGTTLKLDGSVSQTISFAGSTGTLDVGSSSGFGGTVAGQLATGDVLDFTDMVGANAHIVGYTGNNSAGTLTVSDGSHTANINLSGNYSLANFALGTDANGGTDITAVPSGPGSYTVNAGQTLEIDGPSGANVTFAGGTGTLQLDNSPGFSGTISAVSSASGNFAITGQGSVATTSGDAIDFTSSGGAVGTPANVSVTTAGPISASASTATAINVIQNGFGNITVDPTGNVSGGDFGIQAINGSDGNISVETTGTVTGTVQYGILAKSIGAGSISVTTDAGSVINSGSSGIVLNNRASAIAGSSNSSITLTNNATVNAGPTANLSGAVSGGLIAGYNGTNVNLGSLANTAVNGTVVVNNNANVSGAAGYGIEAYNYGNGNVTVNDAANTIVSGGQYGIAAYENSKGTGDVAVNVGANASVTGTSIYSVLAFSADNGNTSISTSAGDTFTSASSGLNASNQATSVSAGESVTVIANGVIHSGTTPNTSGSAPAGILAGFNPGALGVANSAVAGSVFVTSNATIVAAAGAGINAYNYGSGNITVTTGTTSSVTAQAGNGISASGMDGGNVSVTNGGSSTGTTGLFAGATGAGTISIENDGTVTGTVNSGINVNQNAAGSTGSTTITNTGTVVGATNKSAINVNESITGTATINNSGTIGSVASIATAPAITENAAGNVIINNSGTIDGAVSTTSTGALGANTALTNTAGALWQTSYITDEGAITAAGAGSTITVTGATTGIVVGNTGSGAFTAAAGATVTADFLNIAQAVGSHGTATVTGPGTTLNTTGGQFQNIMVGQDGTASLTVSNQAFVTTSNMDIAVNHDAGVTDTLDVNDATILAVGVTIGDAGTANAMVENGGIINTNFLTIGNQATGAGSLTVTGAGSIIETAGIAFGATGGAASLTVSNGGAVEIGAGVSTIAGAVHIGSFASLQGSGTITGNVVDDGNITVASGTLDIAGVLSGSGTVTIDAGATLELGGSAGETVTFANGGTLQLDNAPGFTGTITGLALMPGTYAITGQGNVATTSGDAIDFTSSGGAIGTPANVSITTGGAISASSSTATGINLVQNGVGNITVDASNGVSGGDYGIQAINNSDGNIAVESAGTVTGTVQYGILAKSFGAGSVSVVTDAGSVINSGGSGIVINNRDTAIAGSSNSTITVTANGTINAGPTANVSGSVSGGILAGYNGIGGLTSAANTSVNGTVVVNNNANIGGAAYGIDAYNYGNGNVTVNEGANTTVSGSQYGIGAYENSKGTGDVAVNVGANASVTGTTIYAVLASSVDNGNISISTSAGDTFTSASSGLNASNQSTSVSASESVTVVANGTIHSGSTPNTSGSGAAGILAGYNPGGTNTVGVANNPVAGSVFVTSNAVITAAGTNGGIDAYNYGSGNVTVSTGATSSVTATAGTGIGSNSFDGGNVSVTNGGTVTGTTGLFGQSNGAGTVFVENDGSVTGTGSSNAGMVGTQTAAGSVITLVNTGTVVGPTGRGAIGVNDSTTSTVTITNSGTVGTVASSSTTAPAIAVNGGGASITVNNTGTLYGNINTSGTGQVAANTTLHNNAGGLWQLGALTDEGTITATGSTINVTGTSTGIVISNTGSAGNLTASAGSTVTASFFNLAQAAGSHGTATITGAGTTLTTTSGVAQNITVGQDGTASLTISNQAVVTTTNMTVAGNHDAGITDTLDVNNATLNVTQAITIGFAGTASATVEGGGSLTASFINVANQSTGVGSLTVTGAGSVVSTAGMSLGSTGGVATLNITNGGAIDVGTGTTTVPGALHIGSAASLGGAGTINGNVVNDGNLTVTAGQLEVTGALSGSGSTVIDNGATLKLDGSVSQNISFASSTGTLDIGSSSTFAGTIGGQLAIGDVLDFLDINAAGATVAYSGNNSPGTLTVSDGTNTANINLTGNYSLGNFTLGSDANGKATVVDPPIADASLNSTVALLSNYMASSFASTASAGTGTASTPSPENPTTLVTPHMAA